MTPVPKGEPKLGERRALPEPCPPQDKSSLQQPWRETRHRPRAAGLREVEDLRLEDLASDGEKPAGDRRR